MVKPAKGLTAASPLTAPAPSTKMPAEVRVF
jgi:hypothetical protein